jgi:flagellar hook-associated protein 3 FlgL
MAGSDGANPPFSLDDDGNVLYRGINVTTGEGDGITADDGLALLEKYAGESSYIDLGFGLTFDGKGDVVSSSALDTALPGISVTGYGTDEDGLSNNMLTIMGEMADLLEEDVFNEDKFDALWSKLKDQVSGLQDQFTGLGTKTQLLTTTISRLETEQTNIESRYEDTIGIDSAEAITDYSYASYVYNAALKVGTTILTQSLLDYLN